MQNNHFINQPEDFRRFAFIKASDGLNLIPQAIEKDWWVTSVLRAIYSIEYASDLQFKGGTSLSKCWDMIFRFSEDIDLAINPNLLGFSDNLSKSQVSNRLRREGKNFICGRFTEDLKAALNSTGIPVGSLQVSNNNNGIPTQDPIHIYIEYPSLFPEDTYIAPRIILEITGRANKMALDERAVNALVYDYLPKDFVVDKPVLVTTTQPRRTFIEKVCLLHEEFNKSHGEIRSKRMSRHLYDLYMMCGKGVDRLVLEDEELFRQIIHHRFIYNRIDGVDYNTETPGRFAIIPPGESLKQWEQDYRNTIAKMIYGAERPGFEAIIARIRKLNEDLNAMKWKEVPVFNPGK